MASGYIHDADKGSHSDGTSRSPALRRRTSSTWPAACSTRVGRRWRLVPTWRVAFDISIAGEVLLPGDDTRLGHVTFDHWLADGVR